MPDLPTTLSAADQSPLAEPQRLPWETTTTAKPAPAPKAGIEPGMTGIKTRIHRRLLERLNLSQIDKQDREEVVEAIRRVLHELLTQEMVPLNFEEREALVGQVLDEIFGLGPLEPLLHDSQISDILVNTAREVYIERNGKLEKTDVTFQDDRHLLQVIDRIVSSVGRRIDDSSPMVDARLTDGSRVNAIIRPLAVDGPHLSIRKFKRDALTGEDLLHKNTLNEPMLTLLMAIVQARINVLISGSRINWTEGTVTFGAPKGLNPNGTCESEGMRAPTQPTRPRLSRSPLIQRKRATGLSHASVITNDG